MRRVGRGSGLLLLLVRERDRFIYESGLSRMSHFGEIKEDVGARCIYRCV